jgi:hypothetical protein
MARVPITVMGFRCDRCAHEWIPRPGAIEEPRVCPLCHSALWNQPEKKPRLSYEDFRSKIAPNNQWVHRMEKDIGLTRRREKDGIIHWELKETPFDAPS